MLETRRCPRCGENKLLEAFYSNGYCKPCLSEYQKQRYNSKRAEADAIQAPIKPQSRKCRHCKEEKTLDCFRQFGTVCLDCKSTQAIAAHDRRKQAKAPKAQKPKGVKYDENGDPIIAVSLPVGPHVPQRFAHLYVAKPTGWKPGSFNWLTRAFHQAPAPLRPTRHEVRPAWSASKPSITTS